MSGPLGDPDVVRAALVAVTWLHLGFQAVVSALVYPVLVATGREQPERWPTAHSRHSRVIAPLVGFVYGALLVVGVVAALVVPGPAELVALAAAGGAVAVTATLAAPTHGRLGRPGPTGAVRPDPTLLRLLLRADLARAVLALVAAVAAALAVLVA